MSSHSGGSDKCGFGNTSSAGRSREAPTCRYALVAPQGATSAELVICAIPQRMRGPLHPVLAYGACVSEFELDPGTVIGQSDLWTLVDRNQNLLGRAIVALNRTCRDVRDLTPAEWNSLRGEVARVTSALDTLFGPDHYNFAFLMNVDPQVHLHVIPRYGAPRTWRGLTFRDIDYGDAMKTDPRILPPDDLVALADAVRESLP